MTNAAYIQPPEKDMGSGFESKGFIALLCS